MMEFLKTVAHETYLRSKDEESIWKNLHKKLTEELKSKHNKMFVYTMVN